ncbi:hypothetical protein DN069_09110 [Streptacidiphilus pinicola]|uniref:HTH luxR-type domain-containing protein n=1 Tax=Streptacidiphilus pinicola TaxID=2219663 RepID=A0A2X0K9H5_9ACTN|nr:helix-turn-helix transcriptional regulator [Streptacidiphilus pinicola]RAG85925.1 hypothetical protein DN069_09110 [Streptacidiphilus pinicola]
MTPTTPAAPLGPSSGLVRIAITSPDILAQIRQVFASRNLDVDIVRMPYVEVALRPAAGAAAGPAPLPGVRSPRRLCAEYRLNVVGIEPVPVPGAAVPGAAPVPRPAVAAAPGPARVLSRRQHEVMALVSRGVRNTEIAAQLQLSEKTVKNHINRIFRTLGAANRIEAVLIWQSRPHDRGPGPHARVPSPRGRDGLRPPSAGRPVTVGAA